MKIFITLLLILIVTPVYALFSSPMAFPRFYQSVREAKIQFQFPDGEMMYSLTRGKNKMEDNHYKNIFHIDNKYIFKGDDPSGNKLNCVSIDYYNKIDIKIINDHFRKFIGKSSEFVESNIKENYYNNKNFNYDYENKIKKRNKKISWKYIITGFESENKFCGIYVFEISIDFLLENNAVKNVEVKKSILAP